MSHWTHIVAAIDIETYKEDNNIKTIVEKLLQNAPKITGSERDANVFVNVLSGYNYWIGADCKHCEYGNTITRLECGSFQCQADETYKCPEGKYQTRVVITIVGNLRDRMTEQTEREYNDFLNYLIKDCGFDIEHETFKIVK